VTTTAQDSSPTKKPTVVLDSDGRAIPDTPVVCSDQLARSCSFFLSFFLSVCLSPRLTGGGVGDIPVAPTEAEIMELMNATVEFYYQTMYDAFSTDFFLLRMIDFVDFEAPGVGWNTNFLANVDFSALPSTDDVVSAIESANYQAFIIDDVISIAPYFSFTTGLHLVAGAA
jgi:hypothetical protein